MAQAAAPMARSHALLALLAALAPAAHAAAPLPRHLRDTGLYAPAGGEIAADVRAFTPQYALWSDGAEKRRWIRLPPGRRIDARDPDRWVFPVGTRLWKEFSLGRRVETRMLERTASGWRFATYVWTDDGTDAVLAPPEGLRAGVEVPGGGRWTIPGTGDCKACHEGQADPVLGFTALQLSSDRDPGALHASTAPPANLWTRCLRSGPRSPTARRSRSWRDGFTHSQTGERRDPEDDAARRPLDVLIRPGRPGHRHERPGQAG